MSSKHKAHYDMSEEEQRQDEVRIQLALNRIERAEKHVPPVEGEYCYFDTRRSRQMEGLKPCARYVCVTDHNSVGVDFSISEYIDTYRSHISYQGVLHKIEHDHGIGPLFKA